MAILPDRCCFHSRSRFSGTTSFIFCFKMKSPKSSFPFHFQIPQFSQNPVLCGNPTAILKSPVHIMSCCSSVAFRLKMCCSDHPRAEANCCENLLPEQFKAQVASDAAGVSHPSSRDASLELDSSEVEFASDRWGHLFLAVIFHIEAVTQIPRVSRRPCVAC